MRLVRRLAVLTAVLTYAQILLGRYVTLTGSGLSCPDWPTCWGEWFPPFENAHGYTSAQIMSEWVHRLNASVLGGIFLLLVLLTYRQRKTHPAIFWTYFAGGILLLAQIILGGITVLKLNEPRTVVAHLALATAFFGLTIGGAVLAYRGGGDARPKGEGGLKQRLSDYVELSKPGILFLLVLAALTAMLVAGEGAVSWPAAIAVVIGGSFSSASASALNNVIERDLDAQMARTKKRPLPSHRLSVPHVIGFSLVLEVGSFLLLWQVVNLLAAALALGGLLFYVLIYTMALKRTTPQNIVIGGAAGAFPAFVGWAAVTNEVALPALLLGLLIFLWTPPHFWALALVYKDDYAKAGYPMMPNVVGEKNTARQIFWYTLVLVAASLLFVYPLNLLGNLYLLSAVVLGGIFLWLAVALWKETARKTAMKMFGYSIVYLTFLFVAMVADRVMA